MKTKMLLATLAIIVTPSLAMATCNWGKHEQSAMSCAEGTAWDNDARTCVPIASG